jgi:centromere DNA-binding complex CBF3 subunit-like protein
MSNAYLSSLPIKFLRKMAGFSVAGGEYYLGRATVDPPLQLQVMIFPWVEKWELRFRGVARKQNWAQGGLDKQDIAGDNFIQLLKYLRVVILQDLAILQSG